MKCIVYVSNLQYSLLPIFLLLTQFFSAVGFVHQSCCQTASSWQNRESLGAHFKHHQGVLSGVCLNIFSAMSDLMHAIILSLILAQEGLI
jgi:hypothetical protein